MKTVLIAAALLLATPALAAPAPVPTIDPVTVELWKGSDDGLTNKYSDAIETSFRGSPAFKVVGSGEGEVKVTLLGTQQSGAGDGAFTFSVNIALRDSTGTTISGNCHAETMADCTDYILEKAYRTAKAPAKAEGAKQ